MAQITAIPAPGAPMPQPVQTPAVAPAAGGGSQGGSVVQMAGMRAVPLAVVEAERTRAQEAQEVQANPIASGVAGHIQTCFQHAKMAKRNTIDQRLYESIRSRRGEYAPDKLTAIREQGGSEVWAGLTSSKCRAAGGWIRDVVMGTGSNRPWTLDPTPVPDLPQAVNDQIIENAMGPIRAMIQAGQVPPQQQVTQMVSSLRDQAMSAINDEARKRADRMADKMEDQLIEGGFLPALDAFVDDLTTYPTAFMKGPIIRMKPVLSWGPDGQPVVQVKLVKEWARVSPFNIYPSPGAEDVQDGYLIEKHRLTREDLNAMMGVEGYNDAAIKGVMDNYDKGLNSWLDDLSMQYQSEGKDTTSAYQNSDGLIDALQFWGCVSGAMLIDWGMDKKSVPEPTKDYYVEAWLIGTYVIKAVLNYDPLHRRPYYACSYERVPGNIWGNSVADLVRDPQDVTNAAARSLVNNMALASGPQVGILVDRLAAGEEITQVYPWRIWQMKSDPLNGTTQQPIQFFQPTSNVQDLLMVYDKFSQMADEFSGIPRYLTGETTGGAGRTASGLSMLISNAGKSIKQVINNIDIGLIDPLLENLYYHNMRYEDDPDLKGDVQIVARGATSLVAKDNAQIRRNEFLATTANPIDLQITGLEGRAAVLHEVAKGLDMNPDRVVPPIEVIQQRAALAALTQGSNVPGGGPATPGAPAAGSGGIGSQPAPINNGQTLQNGAPITDNFSPTGLAA